MRFTITVTGLSKAARDSRRLLKPVIEGALNLIGEDLQSQFISINLSPIVERGQVCRIWCKLYWYDSLGKLRSREFRFTSGPRQYAKVTNDPSIGSAGLAKQIMRTAYKRHEELRQEIHPLERGIATCEHNLVVAGVMHSAKRSRLRAPSANELAAAATN